ncbi:unnamed protein product [Dovyalis caffra]|uniref:Uncharacterized protein n=1 Tax=Dovyalis caffra TaxID=77055 RepID=A0AAV1RDQ0_9ROSI|nr:unnamed protein product [Dovyalis caffra]
MAPTHYNKQDTCFSKCGKKIFGSGRGIILESVIPWQLGKLNDMQSNVCGERIFGPCETRKALIWEVISYYIQIELHMEKLASTVLEELLSKFKREGA